MSDSEDPLDQIDEGGDDLFGDEDDAGSPTPRVVDDDDDLASDPDDEGGRQRYDDDDTQVQHETKEKVVMAVQAYRHRVPKPKDNILRVMRVPKFIKIMPEEYVSEKFQPTEFDTTNAKQEHPAHVARVRRNDSTGLLHSNANIYRWSDGSITIGIGGEHFEIQTKALAPAPGQPYDELKDGHYYAAAAELSSNLLMTVGHVAEQYNVRPNKGGGDDALALLAQRMQQASKTVNEDDMIIRTTRDPELQKKEAEMAEKERMKAQRRRENAAAKMDGLGRYNRGGGLSIGDLEGGRRGAGSGRKRGQPGSRPKRRNPEYDSDDDLPQGVRRQEDYDMDDGFLVGSDEEEMESDAEEEEEELLDDDEDDRRRRKSKKRRTRHSDDEDASGDEVVETSGRARRRNVVDDDDD
ncbi:Leo1-like protein [Cordyceps fumosorosea ARSEF 2679]|uniref:Leo1-like protein n=1 Tax=Cordyceps fumosorosea (strain ARSEF 2679) TaxID=1081104 RepID=A0A162JST3_CORFA|nr:Leo1-like protein [Cordyceps fumosorosea ARSEF 2679]OAA73232.1 Leo1-like protein [Cordyceps fumosorosea ARSEF 2679]